MLCHAIMRMGRTRLCSGWQCWPCWFQNGEWVGFQNGEWVVLPKGLEVCRMRRDILIVLQTSQKVQIKKGRLETLQSMKPGVPLFCEQDTG